MPNSNSRDESEGYGLAVRRLNPRNKNPYKLNFYYFKIGFIYIFNLIVGSGALTMPKAFSNSGIILSSFLLIFLNLMRYFENKIHL